MRRHARTVVGAAAVAGTSAHHKKIVRVKNVHAKTAKRLVPGALSAIMDAKRRRRAAGHQPNGRGNAEEQQAEETTAEPEAKPAEEPAEEPAKPAEEAAPANDGGANNKETNDNGEKQYSNGDKPDYDSMSYADLRAMCKDKGISASGKKADLIEKLKEA